MIALSTAMHLWLALLFVHDDGLVIRLVLVPWAFHNANELDVAEIMINVKCKKCCSLTWNLQRNCIEIV